MDVGGGFKKGTGLKGRAESRVENARRPGSRPYLLALALAALLALGAAVPAFAEEPAAGGEPDIQPNIVGGTAVPDGKYQFIAALRDTTRGSSVYQQQYCGGTLIDRNSVLTAGHCVKGQSRRALRVTVGRTVLNSNQGQTRSVERIFIHPNYSDGSKRTFDAAVLKLDRRIKGISPVKIPSSSFNGFEAPGRTATIAGWGDTSQQPPGGGNQSSFPNRMREANVPIVSDDAAKRAYGSFYFPRLMLAAGREGKDTCQGDSGGPIFVPTNTGHYQIGITSFGAGCGARDFPGVYTETNSDYIMPFIFNAAGR